MLQNIRNNAQGTATKIVVGLIVIAFALFGVEQMLLGGGGTSVAEVNGEEISEQQLQQAVALEQRRLISMMGDNFDPAMLDEDRLRRQAMEGLVSRKLLVQSAKDMGLAVSERQIGAQVGEMAQFKVDGKFSPELYKRILSENGYTPASFKRALGNDLVTSQVRNGLAASDFATPAELALNAKLLSEQRDFRYMTIPADRFDAQGSIDDAQITAYYEANRESFLTEESVDLAYIELSVDDFRVPVDEGAVLDAFEVALQEYGGGDEYRVSHILFEDGGDTPTASRVEEALAALDAGEEFAAVAERLSDDPGSAGRGGDLGYTRGQTFPEPMEEAIAGLEPGEVSAPVETDAGTHLVMVTERRAGSEPTLEEMRPQLEESIQAQEARAALYRTVEELRDLAFNAGDLEGPATALDLRVERTEAVTRQQGEGLLANAALRDAAFSPDVLEKGHNSEVIELAGDRFVVLRVRSHHMPELRPLEDVRGEIATLLREEAARAALEDAARNAVSSLAAGADMDELAAEGGYQWQVELAVDRRNFSVGPDVLGRVFTLPAPGGDSHVRDYLITDAGDAVVIELVRVHPGSYDSLQQAERSQLQNQVSREYGGLVDAEYRSSLRSGAEVVVM